MSESSAAAHAEHHREGFIRHYIFSLDHKMIGRQFLFAGLLMLIVGGLLAMMVRWQLGYPEHLYPQCRSPSAYDAHSFWTHCS